MEYMEAILRQFAAVLMGPVFLVLFLLIVLVLWAVGSAIVEYFTERRHFKANLPVALNAIDAAPMEDLDDVICKTGLLWPQKSALLMVANNAGLPEETLYSLAKGQVMETERHYERLVGRTDLIAKIAPMVGLMCTLIPLGPGIVAMGKGQIDVLSGSLGVAFDGTVAGLVAAAVALLISHIRKRWYNAYSTDLEAMMTSVLEKAETARERGFQLPTGFTEKDLAPYREKAKAYAGMLSSNRRDEAASGEEGQR